MSPPAAEFQRNSDIARKSAFALAAMLWAMTSLVATIVASVKRSLKRPALSAKFQLLYLVVTTGKSFTRSRSSGHTAFLGWRRKRS